MGEITKATQAIGAPVTVPEEGPVVSRDEVVTTTESSTTVTTVTKTRAEVNDVTTGKQVTRDTTTTVEKKERNTPAGVILMETKTSESWVKAEEGTLHFIESESTTTRSRPASAEGRSAPQDPVQIVEMNTPPGTKSESGKTESASPGHEPNTSGRKSVIIGDDSSPDTEHLQPPPHCTTQRKSTVSHSSHGSTLEPPP